MDHSKSPTNKAGRPVQRSAPQTNGSKAVKEKPESAQIIKTTNNVDLNKTRKNAVDSAQGKDNAAKEKKGSKGIKDKLKDKKNDKNNFKRKKQKGCMEKLLMSLGISISNVALKDPRALEAAQALDLQPWHLRKLKLKFDLIDIDGSGNIDSDEFFEAVGEQRSPLTDRLFQMIDLDGSGTIEFDEYVRVLATYCMFTKDEILRFCFECFDVDSSGTIDEKEFIELCKVVNNAAPTFPANFKRALEEFDVNEDGLIDYSEFLELDRRYPLVLFPAFRLQDTLQRASLGESVWLRVIERYNKALKLEEYKASHGGRLPPDPFLTKLGKLFFPCLYRQRVHVKLGADMESRHRGS